MRRTSRILGKCLFSVSLLALACATAPVRGEERAERAEPLGAACKPVQIAESTQCVKDQLKPLRDAKTYNETTTVTDNSDSTRTVTFVFEPKCVHDSAAPCRMASRSISSLVDCKAATATCP